MKKYGVNELRKMFLDFMESKGHLVMKSFSLVPQGDKSCPADQCRNGTIKTIFHRSRDSADVQELAPVRNVSVPVILRM